MVGHAVEQLTTIDIARTAATAAGPAAAQAGAESRKREEARRRAGEEGRADPVVAPQPKFPVPSPIPAAKIAGTGSALDLRARHRGNGTGAGGTGNWPGGGGTAIIRASRPRGSSRNIPDRDYRALAGDRPAERQRRRDRYASTPTAAVSNCRIARSSGDPRRSSLLCPLIVAVHPLPARARRSRGRPIAQDIDLSSRPGRCDQRFARRRCRGAAVGRCRQPRRIAAINVVIISDRRRLPAPRSDR